MESEHQFTQLFIIQKTLLDKTFGCTISRNKSNQEAIEERKLSITGGSSKKNRSASHVSFQENKCEVFGFLSTTV